MVISKATQLVFHDAEAFRKEEDSGWGVKSEPINISLMFPNVRWK